MSEEIILKSSIFGGYKKKEVNQYVDSVVEENDKRLKGLQEQITYLTKENNQLKNQLGAEKKISPKISVQNDKTENQYTQKNKTATFEDLYSSKDQDKLQVKQQMELPEGIYIVSKDHSIVNLPDPLPSYRTKGKNTIANLTSEIKEGAAPESKEGAEILHENAAIEAATEQTIKNKIAENDSSGELSKMADGKDTETARKIRKEESTPMQQNEASGEYIDKQYAHETRLSSQKSRLSEDITETQNELLFVKALLEKERHEKQVLAAKLEFSNDLLLQLYRK